jgi:hypothetical protein
VPEGLALAVLLLGGIYTLVEVLLFATSFGAADAYGEAARTGTPSGEVWTTYDLLGAGYLVLLPLWIVTSVFLRRARRRAIALAPGFTHERGPVWTWLGWVVPIVSLWFPFQVVRDIARNAWRDPWGDQRQHLNLGFWWAAWLVTFLVGRAVDRSIPWSGVPDADAVGRLPFLHGIAAVATVIGFVLWMRIVSSVVTALKMPPSPADVTDVTLRPDVTRE